MTFWLSNRLAKQLVVFTRPTRRLLHPPALSLPRQPLCPRTRLVPCKTAANYRFLRGGWDDTNCARHQWSFQACLNLFFWNGTRVGLTAPVERGPSEGARSGSTGPPRVSFRCPSSCGVREHRDRPGYPAPCFSSRQVVTC
jgi:hypothetical protein